MNQLICWLESALLCEREQRGKALFTHKTGNSARHVAAVRTCVVSLRHAICTPCGHPQGKSVRKVFPSVQNLLRAGHVPVECISFLAFQWRCGSCRDPSQPARRDALTLMALPPRLPDLLSSSRSGDAADWLRRAFHEIHNEICQAGKVTEIS